eukprot:TRINITY_DN2613_c0_g2_i1.p1 TRINITY_DN2613_c0_g2~~TRINITY_DN2613_c0_g2_i1.p1  ORF type:complete len:204 (+),score=46.00 TRINITY_DN2613_c0_g2_i1:247-858(+)
MTSNNKKQPTAPFVFPDMFELPPFFTIQPVLATKNRQLQLWSELILAFCRHYRLFVINVAEATSTHHANNSSASATSSLLSTLFSNPRINRKLTVDGIKLMLDHLVSIGRAAWQGKDKTSLLVYWRTPEEWGSLIYKWICDNGMTDTVCTFYEIQQGDHSDDQEFYMIDNQVLMRSLRYLETQRKAQVLVGSDGEGMGVKFFS